MWLNFFVVAAAFLKLREWSLRNFRIVEVLRQREQCDEISMSFVVDIAKFLWDSNFSIDIMQARSVSIYWTVCLSVSWIYIFSFLTTRLSLAAMCINIFHFQHAIIWEINPFDNSSCSCTLGLFYFHIKKKTERKNLLRFFLLIFLYIFSKISFVVVTLAQYI